MNPACSHALRLLIAPNARMLFALAALVGVLSCGGGGGDAPATREQRPEGVYSGFSPAPGITLEQALNWEYDPSTAGEGDGGVGAGADGDGGVGAGGDFGQFRNARVTVRYPDGTLVGGGEALTDATSGMVTIVPRKGYRGPLLLELRGGNGATYYEEGKDTFVDFPEGKVIRAVISAINRNIGITPFSEAAFRLLTEGSTAERAANPAQPTAAEIAAANAKVLGILNQQYPERLRVDDVTRLPFIKSPTIGAGSIGIDARGRYGLVNGAFSKQAAMFNPGRTQPTLDAVAQLGSDLLDGVLDGMNGNQPAVGADARTYDPHTLTGELSSALAEQSYRFGNNESQLALPKVLNYGNARYEGYLFDASLTAQGQAIDTVVGWLGENTQSRTIGQAQNKLPNEARVFGVIGNFGHGAVYFRANTPDSQPKTYVLGDNVNGELGLGDTASTAGQAREVLLPGVLTHAAGGFGHTVARMADGAVYAWGDNSYGQLGTGGANSTVPLRVTLPRSALAVAATRTASYALLEDGSVYAWGSSAGFGLLGDGDKNSVSATPVPVTALSAVVQIAARDNDVAVLRRDGTVWHWGSFPADVDAFDEGNGTLYRGGSPLPQQVAGLPSGVAVRKILTEQGLFAALLADGAVYSWGVHYDITADAILRDLQARRVLGLPPLRDMMPGGFIGYGVRPFDRLTAMGVDYLGGMWKIRGRVAEEFDPANPTAQRRPQGQGPRSDCESCHIPLSGWPLTPEPPTTTDVCQPPTSIHGGGNNGPLLIHAETVCEKCHNPGRQPPAVLFPNGWLTCVKGSNLPPRASPVPPPSVTNQCTIPSQHPYTPPGTACASCHNSVIARPLNDPALNCAQPPNSALPSLDTRATISSAVDDGNATIADGGSTTDATPTLQGSLSAALQTGQLLRVMRNGGAIGAAAVNGSGWSFTDPGAPMGAQRYTARVEGDDGRFGPLSNAYAFSIETGLPAVAITRAATDDNTTIPANGFTADTTPMLQGTLSAALGANQVVRVLRDGAPFSGAAAVNGTSWSFTDTGAGNGAHTYTARAEQGTIVSAPSAGYTFTIDTVAPTQTANVTQIADDISGNLADGASTSDTTPTVSGTLSAVLGANESLQLLRNGAPAATVTGVTPNGWTFTEPVALAAGRYAYTARVVDAAGNASTAQGSARSVVVDTAFPLAGAATTIETINGVAPTGGAVPVNNVRAPVLAGKIQRALAASPAEVVRIYRGGAAVGTASVNGLDWNFTSAALPEGTYAFLARIERSADAQVFGQPSASVNDPIDLTAPGVTITAASNVPPFSVVKGAVPENENIVGRTNDPTPTVTLQLSAALVTGDTLEIRRNNTVIQPKLASCGTNCLRFTDDPGVSIPRPLEAPNTKLPLTNAYTAQVIDAAGNRGIQGSLNANFDYFDCDQVRADTTFGGKHQPVSFAAARTLRCETCHRTSPATPNEGTPAGTFVAVPSKEPTYWCRRPP